MNENDYIEHIEAKHKINPPQIHFDQVSADSYEADIPAEYFPGDFHVYQGKSYKKEVIQFFIAVSGNIGLLKYSPATTFYFGGSGDFEIKGDSILVEFINFRNDSEELNQKFHAEVNGLHSNYNGLIADVESFNSSLKRQIRSVFDERKGKILSKKSLLSSLGVPLRKKENVSATFAVPKPELREKIVLKPVVYEHGYKPEPTLDNPTYHKILKLINDVGRNFERMPSVYKDKGEEDLRDHILMTLDPNFEFGSASGETFNKSGKTDIQLRYDSAVVFIAECKFWSGEKNYLMTIDQLLAYLTWRDTKASVVIFARQKDISAVLSKIEESTKKHTNYLRFVGKSDENWFNYRFHLNGDRGREVMLAVQLFHLPV
ncbi:hypothetical protein [Pedobacter sp. N23S346]|uniref:hypothetical protein n=1 Tax=Pedobacter sp. N23S346 TaxID=3402750 RepID=UPI003AC775CD